MIGRVRMRFHRELVGTPKTCTIVHDTDQWYVCIATRLEDRNALVCDKRSVGVDLGVSPIVALSDGTIIPAPKFLENYGAKIRCLQKSLSRKEAGSRNREKARVKLARAWRKVRNRRNDFVHKVSRSLADNHGTIVFEDLPLSNLVKNHNLASAILDSVWGKLRQLTAYKVEERGGRVILVEPRGTSQECSGCGNTVIKDSGERVHRCPSCGLVLERNVNAARNILATGLERAHVETEPLPVKRIGKFSRGSKKPTS